MWYNSQETHLTIYVEKELNNMLVKVLWKLNSIVEMDKIVWNGVKNSTHIKR